MRLSDHDMWRMPKTSCCKLNSAIIELVLIACIFSISTRPSWTYAQTLPSISMKKTSVGTLDIMLQPSPYPVVKNTQTIFRVTFDQNRSNTVQPHIDYDFTIMKETDKKLIFQGSALDNELLHSVEGTVAIPYAFQQPGRYIVNITVFGILFTPIIPESAQFPINVT
jgi:hypothetical protein